MVPESPYSSFIRTHTLCKAVQEGYTSQVRSVTNTLLHPDDLLRIIYTTKFLPEELRSVTAHNSALSRLNAPRDSDIVSDVVRITVASMGTTRPRNPTASLSVEVCL